MGDLVGAHGRSSPGAPSDPGNGLRVDTASFDRLGSGRELTIRRLQPFVQLLNFRQFLVLTRLRKSKTRQISISRRDCGSLCPAP
jgi:hypothetical protein